jgi:CRISPR/Cas system-associated exonuclease Cas4 (RecB family)
MGQFYNPKRGAAWNYGGRNWKLSRSKIDLFVECPKCFYVDNKLGTKRPPGYPFNLNSAVDALLKTEFDKYRSEGKPHPLMEKHGVKAVPFQHKDLNIWRENFKGVSTFHKKTGMTIAGAVDDVWIGKDKKLIVVDYKSTSKDSEITLDAEWQDGYKRQMEVYQWLLRQNGFDVSNTGYFVYANGDRSKEKFDNKLEFETTVISYDGDDSWVEAKILEIHKLLEQDLVPRKNNECDYCAYRETVGMTLQQKMGKKMESEKPKVKKESKEKTSGTDKLSETGTLF